MLVVLMLTSCASPPSKFGGTLTPTVLRAAGGSAADAPGGDVLAGWADETEQSTNGAITLAVSRRPDSDSVDEDGVVLARLRADDLDIGIIRAPAFTEAGITSFQALQAPFLIDNEELARRVSTDPIATEMLTGLDEIGLVGLALVPGGLRHPVGWHQPLLSLDDFRDAVINTRPSADVDRLFAALGASTDHSAGQARLTAAATGQLRGLDTSLLINITAGAPAIMTSNVVLYTKYDVVVMRRDSFDRLSSTQREALEGALAQSVTEVLGSRPSEGIAVRTWCSLEGQSTAASSTEDVRALHEAGDIVVGQLRQARFTAHVIDRIDALASGTRLVSLPVCSGPTSQVVTLPAVGDQTILDGTWRFDTTRQDLLDVGVPPDQVDKDVGVHTYVLHNGRLEGGKEGEYCSGRYAVAGSLFTWAFDPTSCGGAFQATFTLEGDHLVLDIDPRVAGGEFFRGYLKDGLVRIGDAP